MVCSCCAGKTMIIHKPFTFVILSIKWNMPTTIGSNCFEESEYYEVSKSSDNKKINKATNTCCKKIWPKKVIVGAFCAPQYKFGQKMFAKKVLSSFSLKAICVDKEQMRQFFFDCLFFVVCFDGAEKEPKLDMDKFSATDKHESTRNKCIQKCATTTTKNVLP